MKSVLQYAQELPSIVREELEQLLASFAPVWDREHYNDGTHKTVPISHTPTLTADSGTITANAVVASYSVVGRLCTALYELDITPSATPSVIYATLPVPADATRSTTINSSIWLVGTGPDTAFCKVVVNASGSDAFLYRADFSGAAINWAAIRYSIWFQVSYYIA